MAQLAEDFKIIDADTHYTEPYDLWTSRAPKGYENRVLHMEERDGLATWVVDGNEIGFARGGGVVARDSSKLPFLDALERGLDWVHEGAFDPQARLRLMDECGVHAQVLFPNVVGLGGSTLNNVIPDESLRMLCLQIYNDAMAEMMTSSANRFIPMTLMPAWSVDLCIEETRRAAGLGLRGINMTSDPQDAGSPDLADRAWDPLWKVCSELNMPVHFHIGSSNTAMDFYGNYFWASQDEYVKPAIGGGMLFLNSARVVMNTIFSGVFDRYPDLTMVAVESGIGWIPFILETMDYELSENAPNHFEAMKHKPSEYFAKNWYATFWFEEGHGQLQHLMDIPHIDALSTEAMLRVISAEDRKVAEAVEREIPAIARAVDAIAAALQRGGRLFYIGAGTSGRLGVLDASECPPTFGVSPEMVQGIIAGGEAALGRATETTEDDPAIGARDLLARGFRANDILTGIAASGRTPYVLGAIAEARRMGAATIGLSCTPDSELSRAVDIAITPLPGPEVIAGSTRMKAGTAQKLVLNMLTTGAFVRMGYVYGNLMVNVQPKNSKLRDRAKRIIAQAAGVSYERAGELLIEAGDTVRDAIRKGLRDTNG